MADLQLPEATPVTHTMIRQMFGHGISIYRSRSSDGTLWSIVGHSESTIKQGDYIIIAQGEGSTRYVVDEIAYKADPIDMFEATIRFYPRFKCPDCGTYYDPPAPDSCAVCGAKESA